MNKLTKEFRARYLCIFLFVLALLISNITAETLKITKINNINVSVDQYSKYTLPSKVTAIITNNTKQQVAIKWNTTKIDTTKIGKYTFKGTVNGYKNPIILTVVVKKSTIIYDNPKPTIVSIEAQDSTIRIGDKISLPETLMAKFSDGKVGLVKLKWDITGVNPNKFGTYYAIGKTEGYNYNLYVAIKIIGTPVVFDDKNFEKYVRQEIGKPSGTITSDELDDITFMNLVSSGVTSLKGIEYFSNLDTLILCDGKVTDLSPITNLITLKHLDIAGNNVTDLSPIANLKNLSDLNIRENNITDISVLANLDNLVYLEIGGNKITDVSPLANLKKLETLGLGDTSLIENTLLLKDIYSKLQVKDFIPCSYKVDKVTDNSKIHIKYEFASYNLKNITIISEYRPASKDIQYNNIDIVDNKAENDILLRYGKGEYVITVIGEGEKENPIINSFIVNNNDETDWMFLLPTRYVQSDNKKIIDLAREITKDCKTDMERTTAIHDWISTHIAYDIKAYSEGDIKYYTAIDTLEGGKAICNGYAYLNAALHRAIGIKTKIITGIAIQSNMGETWENTKETTSNHAWNEVFIDGKWIVEDTTWDAGYNPAGTKDFVFRLTHKYFDPTPEQFAIDHKKLDERE